MLLYLEDLMQIKSYIGFVKPNFTQHFTFSTALSAAQDLPISLLESLLLHHTLQKITFGLLSYPCVITYIAALIYPFHTCILAFLKKPLQRWTNYKQPDDTGCEEPGNLCVLKAQLYPSHQWDSTHGNVWSILSQAPVMPCFAVPLAGESLL